APSAGDELRAGEEVAGRVVTDDRPGVVSEPQKRRHGENCDEWDNHQIHPTNRVRLGLRQPKSRSLSPSRPQTGLLSGPGTERSTICVAPLCSLWDHFAAVKRFVSTGWETVTCLG